jgi:ATP-dependent helicase YprA (DUF1998 family)
MIPNTVIAELTLLRQQQARVWQALLPNGRPITAYRLEDEPPLSLKPGDKVQARLSVCDFSQAHLLDECSHPDALPAS